MSALVCTYRYATVLEQDSCTCSSTLMHLPAITGTNRATTSQPNNVHCTEQTELRKCVSPATNKENFFKSPCKHQNQVDTYILESGVHARDFDKHTTLLVHNQTSRPYSHTGLLLNERVPEHKQISNISNMSDTTAHHYCQAILPNTQPPTKEKLSLS